MYRLLKYEKECTGRELVAVNIMRSTHNSGTSRSTFRKREVRFYANEARSYRGLKESEEHAPSLPNQDARSYRLSILLSWNSCRDLQVQGIFTEPDVCRVYITLCQNVKLQAR